MVRAAAPLVALTLLSSCAVTAPQGDGLQPFQTDGCSLFPDRSLDRRADWCHCCVAHDLAYWRGGPEDARLRADRELQACVVRSTGNENLAETMFIGVRAGGGPYFDTPYRWGYGWRYGRNYRPLTPDETRTADRLEQAYRATNPTLACPDCVPPVKGPGAPAAPR